MIDCRYRYHSVMCVENSIRINDINCGTWQNMKRVSLDYYIPLSLFVYAERWF